ncbi:stage II sporulation protein P [Caldicellulosiruptoraceae bacterium PP1]
MIKTVTLRYLFKKLLLFLLILIIGISLLFQVKYFGKVEISKNENNMIEWLISLTTPIFKGDKNIKTILNMRNLIAINYPLLVVKGETNINFDLSKDDDTIVILSYDETKNTVYKEIYEDQNMPIEIDSKKKNTGNFDYKKIEFMNQTKKKIDIESLIKNANKLDFTTKPSILIYHTHTTESYRPSKTYNYTSIDKYGHTLDNNFNVVRVGEQLSKLLSNKYGYKVYHSKDVNDYPEYKGSYTRSLEVLEKYKKNHPDIKVFLDIHRDGYTTIDKTNFQFIKTINEKKAAKVMLVVGTDELGLYHPSWRQNLFFAINLQRNLHTVCPGIERPINIAVARYNQHISPASLIIEIGSNGNTLDEALFSCNFIAEALDKTIRGR